MGKGMLALLLIAATWAGALTPAQTNQAAADDIDNSRTSNLAENHSFEHGLDNWYTSDSDAITLEETDWLPPNGGAHALNYWDDEDYTTDTYQTVEGIDAETYTSASEWTTAVP